MRFLPSPPPRASYAIYSSSSPYPHPPSHLDGLDRVPRTRRARSTPLIRRVFRIPEVTRPTLARAAAARFYPARRRFRPPCAAVESTLKLKKRAQSLCAQGGQANAVRSLI